MVKSACRIATGYDLCKLIQGKRGERDVTSEFHAENQEQNYKCANSSNHSPSKPVSLLLGHLTSEDHSYSWPAPHEQSFVQMIWS